MTSDIERIAAGPWEVLAQCDCGRVFNAWKGDLFFVKHECCPDCGTPKDSFRIRTLRWVHPVRGSWRRLWPIIKPGYWQDRAHLEQHHAKD